MTKPDYMFADGNDDFLQDTLPQQEDSLFNEEPNLGDVDLGEEISDPEELLDGDDADLFADPSQIQQAPAHTAFADLNKNYRAEKNKIKALEAALGKSYDEIIQDANTSKLRKEAKATGMTEAELRKKWEAELEVQQKLEKLKSYENREVLNGVVTILKNNYGWNDELATKFSNNPKFQKELETLKGTGLPANQIAVLLQNKWHNQFSIPSGQRPGSNVRPIKQSYQNTSITGQQANYTFDQETGIDFSNPNLTEDALFAALNKDSK